MSTDRYRQPRVIGTVLVPAARIRIEATLLGVVFVIEKAVLQNVWVTPEPTVVAQRAPIPGRGFTSATSTSYFAGPQQYKQLESWVKVQEHLAPSELALWQLVVSVATQLDDARLGKVTKLLHQAWDAVKDMRRIVVDYDVDERPGLPPPPPLGLELK